MHKEPNFEIISIFKEISSGTKDLRSERKKVIAAAQDRREEGCSYRTIARDLNLNKNTVMDIVHRNRNPT